MKFACSASGSPLEVIALVLFVLSMKSSMHSSLSPTSLTFVRWGSPVTVCPRVGAGLELLGIPWLGGLLTVHMLGRVAPVISGASF